MTEASWAMNVAKAAAAPAADGAPTEKRGRGRPRKEAAAPRGPSKPTKQEQARQTEEAKGDTGERKKLARMIARYHILFGPELRGRPELGESNSLDALRSEIKSIRLKLDGTSFKTNARNAFYGALNVGEQVATSFDPVYEGVAESVMLDIEGDPQTHKDLDMLAVEWGDMLPSSYTARLGIAIFTGAVKYKNIRRARPAEQQARANMSDADLQAKMAALKVQSEQQ